MTWKALVELEVKADGILAISTALCLWRRHRTAEGVLRSAEALHLCRAERILTDEMGVNADKGEGEW